ncbi:MULTISPECIES: Slp family lipoprotein [Providencia]|uniref:Slp family starvation lipoprotein n=1 Tax=Providencia heimbachae ATCC 35613 TaxID=1354272 RepID=A0A1B7K2K5_9GAMM|nr:MULTISPECIES: Slp family lipoprotein [Providencia]MBP6121268.1 Slp family lipoprotein [Providencia sp.]NIH22840.1 Slp family lipoprotein [Providencia heimbachae]OAT54386.1 Slp family starvation lipoprotein [Providencia heimbachae ATCC 35613]SQH13436.1 Outer membrane protein slp precursor [Providencia heimbachae]
MKIQLNYRSALKGILVVGALALTGCVSIPASIQGTVKNPTDNLTSVQNAPEMYIGQEARFGGKVLSVYNEPTKTRLEISVMTLNKYDASPELNSASIGRIYAYLNGFLEPNDFTNRYVTVVGKITGEQQGKVGQVPYKYVTVDVTGYQRWNIAQSVLLPPAGPWGYGYYGDPYYYNHPWGWGYGYPGGPAPVQTYLTE